MHNCCLLKIYPIFEFKYTKTECNHFFHYRCLNLWIDHVRLNNLPLTCPCCRDLIPTVYFYNKIKKKYKNQCNSVCPICLEKF